MFIHTHYHDRAISAKCISLQTSGVSTVSILHCDCLDDFFIPLNTVEEINLTVPVTYFNGELIVQNQSSHITPISISHQLRGPPTLI